MPAPTFAEIFHEAADNCLSHPSVQKYLAVTYSCNAVEAAIRRHHYFVRMFHLEMMSEGKQFIEDIFSFMKDLGLKIETEYFSEFDVGEEKQEVRYAWLKFCAMIAEEEGI